MDFMLGTYDPGYRRTDLLAASARLKPAWVNNVAAASVGAGDRQTGVAELAPGRYYAICLVDSPLRLVVLPDLVVEGG
jgi:hypothetical protein